MPHESKRRRTFAIISHPDAGKTTLTEKLLLYGGAIHVAGAVKARRAARAATSDWMDLERKRGISITSSVMHFEHAGIRYNLLDTPGHQDFSEDTYRTLTAADCAVMLIDAAKGVEPQTRKLFEVCRLRGTPIVTFVNKLDRPARDPMELMSEVEEVLGLHTVPCAWPIGSGDRFQGVYDRIKKRVFKFERTEKNATQVPFAVTGIDDPNLDRLLGEDAARELRAEVDLLEGAGERYTRDKFLSGAITPVFFGSALTSFGVEPFLEAFSDMCPPPGPQASSAGALDPESGRFTAFVFKVQANMDPQHRDRIAFLRVCSGRFAPGMRVHHARLQKEIRLAHAEKLMAAERQLIDEAWAGDVIGLYDPGIFRIGDSLAEGGPVWFASVPRFSPEHFSRVRLIDPLKRKQLQKGLAQLAEEGTLHLFTEPGREKDPVLGVVGELQFDVLKYRLEHEYGAPVELERLGFAHARWVEGVEDVEALRKGRVAMAVSDQDGRPVALMRDDWELRRAAQDHPGWKLHQTAPIGPNPVAA
jgi:peptide chain release factor 3